MVEVDLVQNITFQQQPEQEEEEGTTSEHGLNEFLKSVVAPSLSEIDKSSGILENLSGQQKAEEKAAK